MEEKDDFDAFLERAENVVRLMEAGEEVEKEKELLLAEALRVDPSTVPSTSVEPVIVCRMLANFKHPSSPHNLQDIRQRERVKLPNQNNIVTNSPLKPNSSFYIRTSILFLIFFLLSLYYFHLPRPCPRPLW